jgi:hypothetical protein
MTTTGEATVTIGVVRRMIMIGGATTAIAIPIVRAIGTTVAASMSVPFGTVHRQALHNLHEAGLRKTLLGPFLPCRCGLGDYEPAATYPGHRWSLSSSNGSTRGLFIAVEFSF